MRRSDSLTPVDPPGATPLAVLLRSMHAGDADAGAELWARLSPRLIAYARHAGAKDDAEDAVQRVFVRVLAMRASRVSEVHDVASFLAASVRHSVRDAQRRETRARSRISQWWLRLRASVPHESSGDGSTPTDDAHGLGACGKLDDQTLTDAMARLSPDHRDLLLLKHVAGLTFDQMALALCQPRSTVSQQYADALARMRVVMLGEGHSRTGNQSKSRRTFGPHSHPRTGATGSTPSSRARGATP